MCFNHLDHCVYNCTGIGSLYGIAEQPVLLTYCKWADRILAEIITEAAPSIFQIGLCCTSPVENIVDCLVRVPSKRQQEYTEFSQKVKQAFEESKHRYGALKIYRALNDHGTACSLKRVQRHMAAQRLRSVVVKSTTTMRITARCQMIRKTS